MVLSGRGVRVYNKGLPGGYGMMKRIEVLFVAVLVCASADAAPAMSSRVRLP